MRLIGRYLICDAIASGGMATVHLARLVGPEGFSRTVAIKQLYQHFARDQDFVAMFLDEARILSRIRHPHVVAPLDVLVLDGELFIVMEYVHGASLAELMDASNGALPPRIASAVVIQMLLGLHAAHEATSESGEPLSIVHRDVSPHNVLVGADGIARVVDFGISKAHSRARTTRDGSLKGKLGYMAPEQLRNLPVDRRTDLFTSGIVLWEALTGQRLFLADNVAALFDKLLNTDSHLPSSVSLPPEVDSVLSRALALEPADRVGTAREMAIELERALPPAGTLETSEWVESLLGPVLRRREVRIAALESVDIADLTLGRPRSESTAAATRSPVKAALDVAATHGTLDVVATHGTLDVAATHPVAPLMSAALSGVPVSRDLGLPVSSKKSGRRMALLAALPVAFALSAVGFFWSRTRSAEVRVAPVAPELASSGAVRVASAASSNSTFALAPPRALSAEVPREAAAEQAEKPKVTKVAPAKGAVLPRARPAAKAGTRDSARGNCDVPYTLDERGVKRFKTECFR